MLTLYLARHGETTWNTESRMQGQLDSPLTPLGVEQAQRLSLELSPVELDLIYTSPAPRAALTAEMIRQKQRCPVQVVKDPRIHEMALGKLEGLTVGEAKSLNPENLDAFFYKPERFVPFEGGESFGQVSARMADFLQTVEGLDHQANYRAAVITHNITLKALFALMEKRPLAMLRDGPPIEQAALYRARYDRGWQLEVPGDH